jgi:hypothetical protein
MANVSREYCTPVSLVSFANRILGGPMSSPPRAVPPTTRTAYSLTESPLDCAVRVLQHEQRGRDWRWYRDQVTAILEADQPGRSPIEGKVISAYRTREAEWRAARREGGQS